MKYIAPEDQVRLLRLADRRFRRTQGRKSKGRVRLLQQGEMESVHQGFSERHQVARPRQRARLPIMLPEIFSLRENFEETVRSVALLRDAALRHHTPIQLYFDRIEKLEPAAALFLVSEVYRCGQLRKWRGRPDGSRQLSRVNRDVAAASRDGFLQGAPDRWS